MFSIQKQTNSHLSKVVHKIRKRDCKSVIV